MDNVLVQAKLDCIEREWLAMNQLHELDDLCKSFYEEVIPYHYFKEEVREFQREAFRAGLEAREKR